MGQTSGGSEEECKREGEYEWWKSVSGRVRRVCGKVNKWENVSGGE